jgi:transcriptional regulator with XRE-family HTH domain
MDVGWHVGDVVRKLREKKRWNQQRLAQLAKINKATVVRVEENAPGIRMDTYQAIAKAFDLSLGQLLLMVPGQEVQRTAANSSPAGATFPDTGTDPDRSKR